MAQVRYPALGKRLKELFGGEEQSETAARLDTSQSYISRIVMGKERPGMKLLGKIAQEYEGASLDELTQLGRYFEDRAEPVGSLSAEDIARRAAEETVRLLVNSGWTPPADPVESGAQVLRAGLYDLSRRAGDVIPYEGKTAQEDLTPEAARKFLEVLERQMRERGELKD